jgi:hypothetical protein
MMYHEVAMEYLVELRSQQLRRQAALEHGAVPRLVRARIGRPFAAPAGRARTKPAEAPAP